MRLSIRRNNFRILYAIWKGISVEQKKTTLVKQQADYRCHSPE